MFTPGVRSMLISAFFFSVMGVLVKLLGRRLTSGEIVLARALVSLVLSYALLRRADVSVWGRRHRLLLFRGLVGCLALHGVFFSIGRLPLAEVTVLHFTNPIFTAILAALILREHVSARLLVVIVISLAGVVAVRRPEFLFGGVAEPLDDTAVWVALGAAFLSGCAYVTVRRLAATEHPLVIVFYFPLVTVPLTLPFVWSDLLWPQGWEWAALVGVGVCTQLGQVYLTHGIKHEPAARATALTYTQVVFAATWGVVVFSDYPSEWTVLGAALIMAGAYVNIRGGGQAKPVRSSQS